MSSNRVAAFPWAGVLLFGAAFLVQSHLWRHGWQFSGMTDLSILADDTLIRFYEHIREQVLADERSGVKYRFVGAEAKARADRLFEEIRRRGLHVQPINW